MSASEHSPMSDSEKGAALLAATRLFMKEQSVTCPETIYQSDRVILSAYEFLDKLCEIVGYPITDEED